MYVFGIQIQEGVWVGFNICIEWEGIIIEGLVYIGVGFYVVVGLIIIGLVWIGYGSYICSGVKVICSVLFEYICVVSGIIFEDSVVYGVYSVIYDGVMKYMFDQLDEQWNDVCDCCFKLWIGVDNRSI